MYTLRSYNRKRVRRKKKIGFPDIILFICAFSAVGDTCLKNSDCYQSHTTASEREPMECFLAECICSKGYEQPQESRYCIEKSKFIEQITLYVSGI